MKSLTEIRRATQSVLHAELPVLADLTAALESLDWSERGSACAQALDIVGVSGLVSGITAELPDVGPSAKAVLVDGCRETATHHKWLLVDGVADEFKIWLHEFKADIRVDAGASQAVHDHRYSFGAIILRGGYRHARYSGFPDEDGAQVLATLDLVQGDSYQLGSHQIHSLSAICEGTLSLVIQAPPDKDRSSSVHQGTRRTHIHPSSICGSEDWLADPVSKDVDLNVYS